MSDASEFKLKYIAEHIARGDAPSYVDKSDIQVVNQACVWPSGLNLSRVKYHNPDYVDRIKGWIRLDDILINSTGTGTLGRAAIVDSELEIPTFADGHVTIIRDFRQRFYPKFLFYFLSIQQENITALCAEGATNQIELSRSRFGDFLVYLPPLSEQRAIADYLDSATAKIDALIAAKQRLLDLLAEKRRALITHAVTRGLDATVPLRDSGVEWLGEIPRHWEVAHLRRVFQLMDYGISESVGIEGEVAVLRMGDISEGSISFDNVGFVNQVDTQLLLSPGDLLFNRTNSLEQVGKVGIFRGNTSFPVSFASYLVRMRCNDMVIPEFLNYLLNSAPILVWARSEALPSIGQANLNPNRYSYLPIPLPPKQEQQAMVRYLHTETQSLDNLDSAMQKTIILLHERRTALIEAAVTGKLRVE